MQCSLFNAKLLHEPMLIYHTMKLLQGKLVSLRPSVPVGPSVCPSVDRILSALYLQQYSSDPFHICTSYQASSEGVSLVMFVSKLKKLKFWQILKIHNFDSVFFWLGIQYDPTLWVIMKQWGVSSGVLIVLVCFATADSFIISSWCCMQLKNGKSGTHFKLMNNDI